MRQPIDAERHGANPPAVKIPTRLTAMLQCNIFFDDFQAFSLF
jgi:hypothetical protein